MKRFLKSRFLFGMLAGCLLATSSLLPLLGNTASAASTLGPFSYNRTGGLNGAGGIEIWCQFATAKSCPGEQSDGGNMVFKYVAGSKYTFVYQGLLPGDCPATIKVPDAAHPDKGTFTYCDYNGGKPVAISGFGYPNYFTDYFGASGKPPVVAKQIAVTATVTFGTTNSNLSVPDLTIFANCSSGSKTTQGCIPSTPTLTGSNFAQVTAAGDPKALTKDPVKFNTLIGGSDLKVGQKYRVCITADYLKSGKQCKDVVATVQGAKVSFTTQGDPSKLPTIDGSKDAGGSCESNAGPLGWIMCALIDTLADAVNGIYTSFIVPMLQAPSLNTSSVSGSKIFSAWSSFRVFGNIFLVIVVLIVVFGESIGGGMIDAYTIKKILPRILTAAIMINLSYYGVSLFIDFSNIIGNGVRLLITGPFGLDGNSFNLGTFGAGATATGGGLIGISALAVGGIAAAAVVATGGTIILYAFYVLITAILIPLLFIFLAIMGVLALRLGLLYILVLASPIACALWVLPNTEKYFKKWFELLQTTALVYPIISALFGISMVLGQTTLWAGGAKGNVLALASYIIAIIIVVMPLILIPFAFKLAGGILGRAYELANGQAMKGMGAYNKWRKEKLDGRVKGGNLFRGAKENSLRGRFNTGLQRGGALGGRDLIHPTRASSRYKSSHATHAIEASDELLKAPDVIRGVANDDINNAARSGDKSRESAYAHLVKIGYDEDEASAGAEYIEEMRRTHGRDAFNRVAAIRNAATGTGYKGYTAADGTQVSGATEMVQSLLEASHGDMAVFADSLSKAREAAKQGNRPDLYGVGFTDTLLIGRQLEKGEITAGAASKLLSENAVIKRGMGEQVTQREFSVQAMVGGEVQVSNGNGEKLYYDANGVETTQEWVVNAAGVKIARNEAKTTYKAGTLDDMMSSNEVELKAAEAALQAAQASGDPAKVTVASDRKNRAQRTEARLWAQVADGQDNIGRASMENRKDWARFMNQEVDVVKYEMVPVPVMDLDGNPAIDRNTNLPVTKLERRMAIDPATQKPVFERISRMKALELKRTDDLVLEQRREYSNQYAAAAAGAAAPPGVPAPGDPGTPGMP